MTCSCAMLQSLCESVAVTVLDGGQFWLENWLAAFLRRVVKPMGLGEESTE